MIHDIAELQRSDLGRAVDLFEISYRDMRVPADEQEWFERDLNSAFVDTTTLTFFKIEQDGVLASIAALHVLPFGRGIWAFRWGTTHPDFRRRGLMSSLITHRVKIAEQNTATIGSIHLMARSPAIYIKQGFQALYERGPENKATYLIKLINN